MKMILLINKPNQLIILFQKQFSILIKILLTLFLILFLLSCDKYPCNKAVFVKESNMGISCVFNKVSIEDSTIKYIYGVLNIINNGPKDTIQVDRLYLVVNNERHSFVAKDTFFYQNLTTESFKTNQIKSYNVYWGLMIPGVSAKDIKTISIHYSPCIKIDDVIYE